MAANDDVDTQGWSLVVEFEIRGGGAAEEQAVHGLQAAVHSLGLQTAFVDRVQAALTAAVIRRQASQGETEASPLTRIRIWKSDPFPQRLTGAEYDSDGKVGPGNRSWGFFMVEKQPNDAAGDLGDRVHNVDLHLYPEPA